MKKLSLFLALIMVLSCVFTACAKEKGDNDEPPKKTETTEKPYMVCLGDSITYGQDGDPNAKKIQMDKPYPKIIENTLGYEVDNIAVPGATICTGVERDNSAGGEKIRPSIHEQLGKIGGTPDIISVMGGVNDCGSVELGSDKATNRDTKTLYGGIRVLCLDLKLAYPDAYIFFITPLKTKNWKNTNGKGYKLEDVATAIKKVCAEFEIPVYDGFNEINLDMADQAKVSKDGVHIAADSIKDEVAPRIIAFLRENYKKPE